MRPTESIAKRPSSNTGFLAALSYLFGGKRGGASAIAVTSALLLVAYATPAQAAPVTIAGPGAGAGQVDFPLGLAVDPANGDLYVAEGNNFRVSKFDPDGNFLLAFGYGVADGLTPVLQTCGPQASPPTTRCFSPNLPQNILKPESVAVDQASGDVYVSGAQRVSKFTSSGQLVFMVGRNVNKTKVAEGSASQAEKNLCDVSSGDACGRAESGTAANEFSGSGLPVAVDSSGVVWVGDRNRIASFNSAGAPGAEVVLAGEVKGLAIDSSHDFFVKIYEQAGIRKLEAATGTPLETLDAAGKAEALAVDVDDNLYVGDATAPYRFKVYNPAGEQILQFGAGQVIGGPGQSFFGSNSLAVGSSAGRLYAASSSLGAESAIQAFPLPEPGPLPENQHVEDLLPTTATLAAKLNPEGRATTYLFDWGTTESYGQATATKTLPGTGFDSEDVEAGIEGLTPDTTYHFRLLATNHCNPVEPSEECTVPGPDTTFTTPSAVAIRAQWATDVTAHNAVLHAELDPLGVAGEWWIEYGTTLGYGTSVPPRVLPASVGDLAMSAPLAGLQAATTYHYRFVARDERDGVTYVVHGPDRSFVTQFGGLGFELADDRVWEMVSPANKHGAGLTGGGEIFLQASVDGSRLAYQSKLSVEADPEGNRLLEPSMNLARREEDGSWSSEDITPPNDRVSPVAIGGSTEYKLFSSDLSSALVEPRSGTALSPEASERTPYLRENTEPASYWPLVTGKAPYANVPTGTEFGGGQSSIGAVATVGATIDLQHLALRSGVPLVEGAPSSGSTLYEWSDGHIDPVSVLPLGEGGEIVNAISVGSGAASVRGALSEDGSRVFWTPVSNTALYVRDTDAGESARLDVKQAGATGVGAARPVFQGASTDGSVVFFTDSRQLTESASSSGSDLYRCELPLGGIAPGCTTLTDISVPIAPGESARVRGIAAAISDDGTKIYFVATGVLDDTPNDFGDDAVSGEPNLYLWQQGEGVRFLATLSEDDSTNWGTSTAAADRAVKLSSAASPSGRYLAFMSQRSLTGYDNRDDASGEVAQEVFRYDAHGDQLDCVSCNPTGARPNAPVGTTSEGLVDPRDIWRGRRAAATLPEATAIAADSVSLYRPRAVLENGRVFFNAIDSLVPVDSNGQWDVYQYEPTGVGDCLASSGGTSVSLSAGGCVSLVSSGAAEEEAAFFDASETGDDAFFFTPAQLSVLDEDREVDIYDARVDGVAAMIPPNTECLGEACQPLAQAPDDPTPASAAFRGSGNPHPTTRKHCSKGKRQVRRNGRMRCVAKKHRRSGGSRGKDREAKGDRRVAQ